MVDKIDIELLKSRLEAKVHTIYNKTMFALCEKIEDIVKRYGYDISFILVSKKTVGNDVISNIVSMLDIVDKSDLTDMKSDIEDLFSSMSNREFVENIINKCKRKNI